MSMAPDLEKQPPKDQGGNIPEFSDHGLKYTRPECRSPPQNQGTSPGQGVNGSTQPARPTRRGTFGLKPADEAVHDPIAAAYDYAVKYKPDPIFHELDDNARVWHVYNDEAAIFDADMIEEASDSLDILMVFAGLFSAVLTTFVVQTSQALAPNSSTLSAALLQELVDLQRAQAKGISLESIPQVKTSGPSSLDVWVNGLWFASLTLSLSSALVAVLVKQWLRHYRSSTTGSPRSRALIRQLRSDSFKKWYVRPIIGLLPTLLHIALFLFLVGLVLFLIPLNTAISILIGVMTFLLLAIYIATILLPAITILCPYLTPISDLIYRSFGHGDSLKDRERFHVQRVDSSHEALAWLGLKTSNQSVAPIVAESVTALWKSDHERYASGQHTILHSTQLKDLVSRSFSILYHGTLGSYFGAELPDIESNNYAQLGPERAKKLQHVLLLSILHDDHLNGMETLFLREELAIKELTVSSSDPSLGLLALSSGLSARFLDAEEGSLVDNAMHVSGNQAFSWLLNNHSKLTMPKLHPAVWEKLQKQEGWKVQNLSLQHTSADLKALIKESRALRQGNSKPSINPPHQPVSLALFVKEQILPQLVDHLFGNDISTLDEWLALKPAADPAGIRDRASDDGIGLEDDKLGGSLKEQESSS